MFCCVCSISCDVYLCFVVFVQYLLMYVQYLVMYNVQYPMIYILYSRESCDVPSRILCRIFANLVIYIRRGRNNADTA